MSFQLFAKDKKDTPILDRIYEYHDANISEFESKEDYVYSKIRYNVERRNPTLWLIPTMYVMAKDPREYIREAYGRVKFLDPHRFEIIRQVRSSTIPHNEKSIPTLIDFMTPDIYNVDFYEGHVLSPFNKWNRHFYQYSAKLLQSGDTRLDFRPKSFNTQLLNGYAVVETETGRILRTVLNGEFDMITFRTEITQDEEEGRTLSPIRCNTAATFRFSGNRISVLFNAYHNCSKTLPDSITDVISRELMDSLRPMPLNRLDKKIYEAYDKEHAAADSAAAVAAADSIPDKPNLWKKIFWDTIGETLVTPISAESGNAYFRISPIINPLYVDYSDSHGLRYKMKFRAQFSFSQYRYLSIEPNIGYNFKRKQIYFTIPVRMTYNPKRNGYVELIYGNGNRISNSTVLNAINEAHKDTLRFDEPDMDKFDNNYFYLFNNIMLFDWLDLETGLIIHQRTAVMPDLMRKYGMPVEYRSFAPVMGIKLQPWLSRGPLFAIDWERAIKGINGSNLDYDRWEFDAQWKYHIPGLRLLNMRVGYGIYARKAEDYFVDFANFSDQNLPSGWEDDWSGNFQLLGGDEYNRSNHYLRGNISYESPLLMATWIPYLGKYIEKERFYLSGVKLERSRPYFEIGYGFTNRYISAAAFASFRNTSFENFGVKFDFELFRRW